MIFPDSILTSSELSTDYWYADGNNPKRKETIDEAEEEGENCWSRST